MDFELRTQGSTLLGIPYWACGSHCTALEHSHVRTASNIFARRVLKGCLGEIPHMWTSSDGRSTDGRLRRLGNQLTIFMCRRFHSLTSDIMGGSLTGPNQGLLSSNLKGLDETMKSSTVRGSGPWLCHCLGSGLRWTTDHLAYVGARDGGGVVRPTDCPWSYGLRCQENVSREARSRKGQVNMPVMVRALCRFG